MKIGKFEIDDDTLLELALLCLIAIIIIVH